ncbi:MAG: alpha/beta hydrolase [Pseudomonadota bacterium]
MTTESADKTDQLPPWFTSALDTASAASEIEVDGATIAFETWGPQNAPGIVLIHGSNAHREWWRFVAPFLADQFRVAALDLSGNGDSGWRERYSAEILAREVWAVCEAAHLGERPFIVGHSFGGFVALEVAHRYGADMGGVIFNDFTVAPRERYVEWGMRAEREDVAARRGTRVYPDVETAMGRFRFIPEQPTRYPPVLDYIGRAGLHEVEGGVTWKFDPALFDYLEMGADQEDKFVGLACRSAVVLGEFSEDEGAFEGEHMRDLTAGALPVFHIPGTHHHMMFEEPVALAVAFKAILLGWLAEDRRPAMTAALAQRRG